MRDSSDGKELADEVREDLIDVISPMVDRPDDVQIHGVPMRRATVFEVETHPDDLGQVIGRRGRIARALRAVLDARGDADGQQYGLEIVDD